MEVKKEAEMNTLDKFLIENKVVIITGGAGLLGCKHAEAVLDGFGIPVLLDISEEKLETVKEILLNKYVDRQVECFCVDITQKDKLQDIANKLLHKYKNIYGLINNAANNPKVENTVKNMCASRFEEFSLEIWNDDVLVGLTGAFLCSQVFGKIMADNKTGVIINISSDLGIIAPDQRIYKKDNFKDEDQMVKPVTYSVIKHGLLGLTKYLATYWADSGVRVNSLCPAGVSNNQDNEFVNKLVNLIPMGRMADKEEYKGTILYMLSQASSYMTGSTVIIDGGRTVW